MRTSSNFVEPAVKKPAEVPKFRVASNFVEVAVKRPQGGWRVGSIRIA